MRKVYYVVGSCNKRCLGGAGGLPELFTTVGYNKQSMEKKKRELEKEYPDYLFWIGWQWKDTDGLNEVSKIRKHWSIEE